MTNAIETLTKLLPFKVNPNDPFEGDALDRKELCEGLENFIQNSTTPYTLAINASWGNGKTVFLQMLEAHLKKQGFLCVFFDAWEADFYDNALSALIGEIKEQIKTSKGFNSKARKLGKALISSGIVSEFITAFVKAVPVVGESTDAISTEVKKSLRDHDSVEHYLKYREALKEFKESLRTIAQNNANTKPLVILVDELDRCRPDFALDVLEKIKHIFNVKSVFFVFGLNKKELGKTIEKIYGGINAAGYLRRFFDETINLVNTTNLLNRTMNEIGLTNLLKKRNEQHLNNYNLKLPEYLNLLFEMFNLSLRDQQQVLSSIKISLLMTPREEPIFPVLLSYFTIVKLINPSLFQKSKIGADWPNQSSFPCKEHLEFYRKHAGFESHEDFCDAISKDSHHQHHAPYLLLNAIYYQHDDAYKRHVNQESDENRVCHSVRLLADNSKDYLHVPGNPGYFIDKIDSIGKLILDSEIEKDQ